MTEQEAMETIMQVAYDGKFTLNSNKAFGIACKCIEKQIPQKPRFYNCNYYCPICDDLVGCHDTIMKWDNKFCKHCGQAIKWE